MNVSNLFTIAIQNLRYAKDSRTFEITSPGWNMHGRVAGTIKNELTTGNVIEVIGKRDAVKFIFDNERFMDNEGYDGILEPYVSLCGKYKLNIINM